MEIPVYVIVGFLESGKTSFLRETLESEDFTSTEKSLLIACEEGEEEYEESFLKKVNTSIEMIEDQEELTPEKLEAFQKQYHPDRVLIEYNGMWKLEDLMNMQLPKDWAIVQVISIINAETFSLYLNNMRSLVMEEFTNADMIIFNRCEDDTPGASYLRSIKAVNRRAGVYFETKSGKPLEVEEELPFDLDSDIIEIEDIDFGVWYIDAMEESKKYDGKTVRFKGLVYKGKKFARGTFVPGRFAMTCCADDISFFGFICKGGKEFYELVDSLENREWVTVTAKIRHEFCKDYMRKGPVLYPVSIERSTKPKEELIYF
ncbi:TIGR03943 family putative permease subunit [[Clostridium] polysaccharolyticum]|uniref:TIGR03943 family protein n=1 Tax=[Clostridium] polysaccharolyticum TaxID=29364 RepID=A0A1I0D0U5_9FIRM|nr:GTP-binding protein [[Clostridium] polysaccharolyticum]SET25203.1 TIGR03943 family protein [[Clostridium] polysaccharolyticum]